MLFLSHIIVKAQVSIPKLFCCAKLKKSLSLLAILSHPACMCSLPYLAVIMCPKMRRVGVSENSCAGDFPVWGDYLPLGTSKGGRKGNAPPGTEDSCE